MTVADIAKNVLRTLDTNSPLILTGLAVGGLVSTVVLAVKATPEALETIDYLRLNEKHDGKYELPHARLKMVKATWQLYIPAAGMGLTTAACIIGAQSINSMRQAALISGFSLSEAAFKEYREKVVEKMGERKEQSVVDDIAKDRIAANPPSNQVVIMGGGDVLCYDTSSGHYFNSSMETLRRAENDINRKCINEMYASHNDFYQLIGIPSNQYGNEFGWSTDNPLELRFSAVMSEDNTPCIAITYRLSPVRDYYKFG